MFVHENDSNNKYVIKTKVLSKYYVASTLQLLIIQIENHSFKPDFFGNLFVISKKKKLFIISDCLCHLIS